jgi:hypothetical protein
MTLNQDEETHRLRAPTAVIADYLRRSISVSYLAGLVWKARLFVLATTVAGLIYGVYMVHVGGPSFTATIKISPAESDSSMGDVGGGGAGGLLAGLTGTGSSAALPKFTQFQMALGSVGVARDLDNKYDLLCRTFRGNCDPATHKWRERTGIKEWMDGMLAKLAGLPDPNGARSIEDLAMYVGGSVPFMANKVNSAVEVSYTNSKPEYAAWFLSAVVKSANDYVRAQSRETQKRYVEYLSDSAAKVTNVEQRTAIDTLLLQEERQLMLTEVDTPYAAKIMDGPIVAPVYNARKIIAVNAIMGMFMGMILAILCDLIPRKWRFW